MERSSLRDQMLAGVGARSYDLDVGGVRTRVLEAGDGPPLLLLHGGIECGGIMWTPVMADLARRYRVIAPDVPGLGESEPVDNLDLDAFTRWFNAFLQKARAERPALVAHSLLGSMAASYASHRSFHLGRLIIYGAPGVGPYRMPRALRYTAIRFAIRPTPRNLERFERFAVLDLDASRRRDPQWFQAFEAYNRAQAARRHVKQTMNRLISDQTRPIASTSLGRIDIPVSLLWGRHDRMVPITIGQAASKNQGWPLHVIEGAAHAPHIEIPERFAATITTVLGHPPAGQGEGGGA